ncbi:MAG: alpha/beta hydrolase [Chloroflexi bacterium]|nr:alpha/beta hydrolase [Chloroflexota bacterium]
MPLHTPGASIHYEVAGAGPPLLLLHGPGDTSQVWDRHRRSLVRGRRVITLDQRGHGQTRVWDGRGGLDACVNDVASVVRALGIAPVALVGHSLGGYVAAQFAAEYPHFVVGLVLANCAVTPAGPAAWVRGAMEDPWELLRGALVDPSAKASFQRRMALTFSPGFAEESPALMDWYRSVSAGNDHETLRSWAQESLPWITPNYASLTCPTLVLAGQHDWIAPPEGAQSAKRLIGGSAKADVIPGAHGAPFEASEEFLARVVQFLDDETGGG